MINKFQKQKEIIENNKIIRSKSYLGSSVFKKRRRIATGWKKRLSDKQINKYVHASHVEV